MVFNYFNIKEKGQTKLIVALFDFFGQFTAYSSFDFGFQQNTSA